MVTPTRHQQYQQLHQPLQYTRYTQDLQKPDWLLKHSTTYTTTHTTDEACCSICLTKLPDSNSTVTTPCQHTFCRSCMNTYFEKAITIHATTTSVTASPSPSLAHRGLTVKVLCPVCRYDFAKGQHQHQLEERVQCVYEPLLRPGLARWGDLCVRLHHHLTYVAQLGHQQQEIQRTKEVWEERVKRVLRGMMVVLECLWWILVWGGVGWGLGWVKVDSLYQG